MYLSIVTTLYNSAAYLEEFHTRVTVSADKITDDYEIVLVNDGSPDDSLELALSLYEKDSRIRIIDLSRNFGHHKAIMTGLSHTDGDLVFLLDSDLEEDPEFLEAFHDELRTTKADVVFGVQDKRKGKFFERVGGQVFFKLFNALSDCPLPKDLITARLMTREYVSALVQHQERETQIAGLWALTGFRQVPFAVRKHHRNVSSYNLQRRISNFVNAVTSFSNKPLVFIFYLGCFILLVSSLAALDLVVRRVFYGQLLQGWPSLIVSIWLLGGLTLFSLGIVGIYLSKIFIETKQRPYTIIKRIYEWTDPLGSKQDSVIGSRAAQWGKTRAPDFQARSNAGDVLPERVGGGGSE
jgi:putative glycosyltransferase